MIQESCKFDELKSDDNGMMQGDGLEKLSSKIWSELNNSTTKLSLVLRDDCISLPNIVLSEASESSDPDDSTFFVAADKDDEQPIKEFKRRGVFNDPLTEYTVKIYEKSAAITDANGVQTDVTMKKVGDGSNSITKATMNYDGKEVGKISDGEYSYLHHGQWKKIKIESSTFRDDGVIELKTEDKTTILIKPDGSKIEMDKAGRPILVDDANGNRFEYKWNKWPNGNDKLEYVSMQGPMTNKELIEYKFTLKVDNHGVPFPESYQNLYKVYVKGVHQASSISFGAGCGAGLQYGPASAGVSAGFCAPLGKTVELRVGGASLTIKQGSEVLDGLLSNETTSYTLVPDGTTLQQVKSGWLSKSIELVGYDKQGNKRIRGR
jgi:hypothetical protein